MNDVNRNNEYVVVERGGLPVAVIMDFDEFEDYLGEALGGVVPDRQGERRTARRPS